MVSGVQVIDDGCDEPLSVRRRDEACVGPADDVAAICDVLGRYGCAVRDAAAGRLARLFHPRAVIYSAPARAPMAMSVSELISVLDDHLGAPVKDMDLEVVSIEVDGDVAWARTIGRNVHNFHYRGLFTLVRHEGRWLIGAEATMGEVRGEGEA